MPFELNSNKVYLPVRVNDRGPFWFVLDTGSISNVVDSDRGQELGIAQTGGGEIRGAGEGALPSWSGKNVGLAVGGITIAPADVELIPISRAVSFSEGRRVDGLLGCPFFSRAVVEIDYVNSQVNFYEPGMFHYQGRGQVIPFEIQRGNIFVTAAITFVDGKQISDRFLVDTGWRSALSLTTPFVNAQRMHILPPTIQVTSGIGIGGPVNSRLGRIRKLQMGPYAIQWPFTDFEQARSGILAETGMAGIIGAEILRRFKVILDYPRRQLILEPNRDFPTSYQFDMSGLYVTAEGDDFRTFRVFKVIVASPGAEAGLKEGDLIETIDRAPASSFTLEQIRRLFRSSSGRRLLLAVRRAGKLINTELTLRRLI